MEAKDKAKELVEMFSQQTSYVKDVIDYRGVGSWKRIKQPEKAKACAIICVDEISKIASSVRHYGDMQLTEYGFWQQVKEEIKNL